MFANYFSSPAAAALLAQAWPGLRHDNLSESGDPDGNNFFNAAKVIHDNLSAQDKPPFLTAANEIKDKLGLLSKPGELKIDDILSALGNQLTAALTLAKKAKSGYQQFQDSTREFLISQIVQTENLQRNQRRRPQDSQGQPTQEEAYGETFNEFRARYHGQRLRELVGPPPDEFRIGKNDKPDEYYRWSVYGLKKGKMEMDLMVDGNIAAYWNAANAIQILFTRYGEGTPKANEKIDSPDGDYKASPIQFRANALSGMIKALTTYYDATKSRVADPSKSDEAKHTIVRSIALVESQRGAFGLADGRNSHSLADLPPTPSDADRQKFEARFPGVIKMWEALGDDIRKNIEADPNVDRSNRVPVLRRQGFLRRDAPTGRPDEPKK
jgi:hypothetical protein